MPANFVFTDPVAAQQLVRMAELDQAAKAQQDQAILGTLGALGQQRIARENSALERSRLQSNADMNRALMNQQATEGERNRLARASEIDKTIQGNERIAKTEAEARARGADAVRAENQNLERYNQIFDLVNSNDPPTDTEFEQLASPLTSDRKGYLDNVRKRNRVALDQAAGNAESLAAYWNREIAQVGKPEFAKTLEQIVAEASKSKAGNFILFDPKLGQFVPLVKRPRVDPAGPTGVQTIDDVLNKVRTMGGRRLPGPTPGAPGVPGVPPAPPILPVNPNLGTTVPAPAPVQIPTPDFFQFRNPLVMPAY